MKRTAREALRTFVVSPESLAVAIVALLVTFLPAVAVLVGSKIQEGAFAVVSTVIGAPVALTVATWYRGMELLRPSEEHRKVLVEWPDYWRLTLRTQCALLWSVCGVLAVTVGLLFVFASHPRLGASGILAGVSISAVAMATTALTSIVVRDILDGAQSGG